MPRVLATYYNYKQQCECKKSSVKRNTSETDYRKASPANNHVLDFLSTAVFSLCQFIKI